MGRNLAQTLVNCSIEEFAASDGAARFGDGNFAVLHTEFFDYAGGEVAERSGGGGKDVAGDCVTIVTQLRRPAEKCAERRRPDSSPPNRARESIHCIPATSTFSRRGLFAGPRFSSARTTAASARRPMSKALPSSLNHGPRPPARAVWPFASRPIRGGAGANDQDDSLAFRRRQLQGDFKIGRHQKPPLRERRVPRKVAMRRATDSRPAPPIPAQMPRMSLAFR